MTSAVAHTRTLTSAIIYHDVSRSQSMGLESGAAVKPTTAPDNSAVLSIKLTCCNSAWIVSVTLVTLGLMLRAIPSATHTYTL